MGGKFWVKRLNRGQNGQSPLLKTVGFKRNSDFTVFTLSDIARAKALTISKRVLKILSIHKYHEWDKKKIRYGWTQGCFLFNLIRAFKDYKLSNPRRNLFPPKIVSAQVTVETFSRCGGEVGLGRPRRGGGHLNRPPYRPGEQKWRLEQTTGAPENWNWSWTWKMVTFSQKWGRFKPLTDNCLVDHRCYVSLTLTPSQ